MENFLNKNNQESNLSKDVLMEKNNEIKKEVLELLDELGGIDGVATTTTPEIQSEFNDLNLEKIIGKIKKAETALNKDL